MTFNYNLKTGGLGHHNKSLPITNLVYSQGLVLAYQQFFFQNLFRPMWIHQWIL